MDIITTHPLFIPIAVTIAVIAIFPLMAGYIVLVERKVLADFQVRLGPMRVGFYMNFEPIASVVLAALILGQRLEPVQLAGGALVVAALFVFRPSGSKPSGALRRSGAE